MKPRSDDPEAGPRPPTCSHDHPRSAPVAAPDRRRLDRAAGLFRALGDAARLRILHLLLGREVCVGEVVAALGEKFSTVSQRLRVLRTEGLVARRRDGSHVYYALADAHVRDLVSNALAHADELGRPSPSTREPEDDG